MIFDLWEGERMFMNFIKKMYRYYCPNWLRKIYRAVRFRHEFKKFKKWTETTSEVIQGQQEKNIF